MKPFLFLDVDGTILAENEDHANSSAIVTRTIEIPGTTKTVNGFTITAPLKRFPVEEEIFWNKETQQFLRVIEHSVEIVWLTGWKHNIPAIEKTFNLQPHQWLDWKVTSDESGKLEALHEFLLNHPETPFIWADDVAIKENMQDICILPKNRLLLTPEASTGLTSTELQSITEFIQKHI